MNTIHLHNVDTILIKKSSSATGDTTWTDLVIRDIDGNETMITAFNFSDTVHIVEEKKEKEEEDYTVGFTITEMCNTTVKAKTQKEAIDKVEAMLYQHGVRHLELDQDYFICNDDFEIVGAEKTTY